MSGAGLEEILVYISLSPSWQPDVIWACFQSVKVHYCRFVVSRMLDLVGDIRVFALNTVRTSPGSQELPGQPLACSWVEQPNKVTHREWVAMNLPVIQLPLVTLLHRYILPSTTSYTLKNASLWFCTYCPYCWCAGTSEIGCSWPMSIGRHASLPNMRKKGE